MVTLPVIAIMARIIRLSCRKVVMETLFCIGCKSAIMFIGGFLFIELLSETQLYFKNPLISAYFGGELNQVFYKLGGTMPINRKLLWFIPIIFGFVGCLLAPKLAGFYSTWKKIGKPSDNITQIIGIVEYKIIVLTDKGETYSLDIMDYSNASWTKEENQTWETEPYRRTEISTWPPPFHVKQLVTTFLVIAPECTPSIQIGLSQAGELWIWKDTLGCGGLVPSPRAIGLYCLFPILGLLLGGLLVGLGLGLSKNLAKRKQSSAL